MESLIVARGTLVPPHLTNYKFLVMCVGRIKKLAAELKVCTTERWVVRKLTALYFGF